MTKVDIVNVLWEEVGLSKKESEEIVELIRDTLKETLGDGESIKIS
ncbi:MAG: HU family DNA-binding protein, partial [Candidatus Omnitrophica bacterium]|nr:HU family DNA-binding protein [Candidatus Omnitrophota bacterium]